ncbi:MAG: LysM domain-containing protein [Anaerolineales bacterium]|nr:MAG: LysM domain-containing protein [Anaerolineales bacterium]
MAHQRLRNVLSMLTIALFVVALSACTRSASTPPPAVDETGPEGAQSETQATMDAVRSAILTQTAQAGEGGIATPTPTGAPALESPTTTGTPATAVPTATPLGQEIEYTVQAGDWIFKIARDFNVDPQDIIDLNNFTASTKLMPGMVLKIPVQGTTTINPTVEGTAAVETGTPTSGTTVHIVKPGEWIWQIARIYGVDPQAIIDANNLTSPANISPGDELIIP